MFRRGTGDDVLGLSVSPARRAYVLYDRIAHGEVRSSRDVGAALGDVMAHEIGHLMLPAHSHSATGFMRSSLDMHSDFLQSFDEGQARLIRIGLTADVRP